MAYYRRKLPHWQPKGAQYFLTLRLKGSIPLKVINELKLLRSQYKSLNESLETKRKKEFQREIFGKYESALDFGTTGPMWLKNPGVAKLVQEAIHYRDSKEYHLFAYCIMANHVHLVIEHIDKKDQSVVTTEKYPITEIFRKFKRFTALECNKILNRKGAFWQSESYDRVIRDSDELENTIAYTLNNPVKVGLVKHWRDWPHTYCKPEYLESFR